MLLCPAVDVIYTEFMRKLFENIMIVVVIRLQQISFPNRNMRKHMYRVGVNLHAKTFNLRQK